MSYHVKTTLCHDITTYDTMAALVLSAVSLLGGAYDDRWIANCISGSREAINMGQGLYGRETIGRKHITQQVFDLQCSCYKCVFHLSGNCRNDVYYAS